MDSNSNTSSSDPVQYFGLACCHQCLWKPCKNLRLGGVWHGKIQLVHNSRMDQTFVECPFFAKDWDETEEYLSQLSFLDLSQACEDATSLLSVAESITSDHHHFIKSYDDFAGRIEYLKYLWQNGIVYLLRIPHVYHTDSKLSKWLNAFEAAPELKQAAKKEEAITDTMEAAPDQGPFTVSNPRWEHKDEQRKKTSATKVFFDDAIVLMADVSGIPDGAGADFFVYDNTSSTPTKSVDKIHTRVDGGTLKAEWTVKDPRGDDDKRIPGLEFEAIARDKSSGKAPIDLIKFEPFRVRLPIDPNDAASRDDTYTLYSTDEETSYRRTLTIANDLIEGDANVDLEFSDVRDDLSYTLEVDLGAEGVVYNLFEKRPFRQWHQQ
jgi:hypothetical protein